MTFEIALTGINAASAQLEVISHNIANNATNGFKRSRAEFADVYALTATGTSTGSGVRVSQINQEFGQGDLKFTNNNMDLSIAGEGFFRMDDHGTINYSRAGTFGLNNEGFIVNSSGHHLTGYVADDDNNITSTLGNLKVSNADLPPKATNSISMGLNLDSKAEATPAFDVNDANSYNFSTSTTTYDSLGSAHETTTYFHKDGPNEWSAYTFSGGTEISQAGGDKLVFTSDGLLDTVNGGASKSITTIPFSPSPDASEQTITIDISDTNQFDNPFGVNKIAQNGFSTGRLQDIEIDSSGIVYGRYSNRESKALGQVAMTNFANPQGLRPVGDSAWAETFSSGSAATGTPGSASLGLLQAGSLEESNVDITEELVAMIGAQRSFQANAQVISTADTLTQTIINIR